MGPGSLIAGRLVSWLLALLHAVPDLDRIRRQLFFAVSLVNLTFLLPLKNCQLALESQA